MSNVHIEQQLALLHHDLGVMYTAGERAYSSLLQERPIPFFTRRSLLSHLQPFLNLADPKGKDFRGDVVDAQDNLWTLSLRREGQSTTFGVHATVAEVEETNRGLRTRNTDISYTQQSVREGLETTQEHLLVVGKISVVRNLGLQAARLRWLDVGDSYEVAFLGTGSDIVTTVNGKGIITDVRRGTDNVYHLPVAT